MPSSPDPGAPVRTPDALLGHVVRVDGDRAQVRIRALVPRWRWYSLRDLEVIGAPEAVPVERWSREERRRAADDHQMARHETGCPPACPWSGVR